MVSFYLADNFNYRFFFLLFILCILENMAAVAQEVERLGSVGRQFDPPTLQSACWGILPDGECVNGLSQNYCQEHWIRKSCIPAQDQVESLCQQCINVCV